MKIINKGLVSLDEIQAPEVLYKYRNFDDPNHLKILLDHEVYFAPPASFKDEFDCNIPVRFDLLTEEEIYEIYISKSKEMNRGWAEGQHQAYASDWTKKSPLKDKAQVRKMTEYSFKEYNKRVGILSLTANNRSVEMWNRYSNSQKGFCIGFNTKILIGQLGACGPVYYFDELPCPNN